MLRQAKNDHTLKENLMPASATAFVLGLAILACYFIGRAAGGYFFDLYYFPIFYFFPLTLLTILYYDVLQRAMHKFIRLFSRPQKA